MTRVTRTPEPSILQKKGSQWLSKLIDALNNLRQIEADPAANKASIEDAKKQVVNIQKKYNHDEIKKALVKMFHGKCAYCESLITVVTYGHIEHFYPKSRYADKTFEWSNLLLACPICNDSKHKGTKFPLDTDGNPMLIDPSDGITEPALHLNFYWDDKAKLASIYGISERGRNVESIFELNGREALIKERSRYFKRLMPLLRIAQIGDSEAIALVKEACQPDAPYRAFALTYVYPYIQSQENQLYDNK